MLFLWRCNDDLRVNSPTAKAVITHITQYSRSCQEKNYIFLHLTFGLTVRYAYTNDGRRELMEG